MMVVPAIDLLGGKAVRLEQGRYDRVTVYDDAPADRARAFAQAGAKRLHVVDLEAARKGSPAQQRIVEQIVRAVNVPVQVGGGIRKIGDARAMLGSGAAAVVMGTSAIRDPQGVEMACRCLPGNVIVAIDARDGRVAVEGWTETSDVSPESLAAQAARWGAAAVLYTDVARDGMRVGPDVDGTRKVAARAGCPVYASGGVGRLADLVELGRIEPPLAGVIVGRALYSGAFTLAEAIETC